MFAFCWIYHFQFLLRNWLGRSCIRSQKIWKNIKATFVKNNKLKGLGGTSEIAQVLAQMMQFSENLEGIQEVLRKGLEK